MESIIGSVFVVGGVIAGVIGDIPVGCGLVIMGWFFSLGLPEMIFDWKLGKEWRDREV